MSDIDKALLILKDRIYTLMAVYIFGSYGSEYQSESSDLDIAVLSEQPLNSVELWNIAQDIASEINRDVDLVDLFKASTVFRYQVITEGKRIYCTNEARCDLIENTYMSMYLRFNRERLDILKDNSGRVNG